MKVLVVLCHPKLGSFNHAIAARVAEDLAAAGHQVRVCDLYAEGFDPVYTAEELPREAVLPAALQASIVELREAEGLVVVHPNYWSRPPAMLCGWVDRVLRPGQAYQFVPDGKGGAKPQGLLKLCFAAVIVTANTPRAVELEVYGDPLDLHWRKVVFGLCGVPKVELLPVGPVITSSPEKRQQWLAELSSAVMELSRQSGRQAPAGASH